MPRIQRICAAVQRSLVRAAAAITAVVLLFLVGYILVKGIPHLSLDLFAWKYNSTNVSFMPALINTLLMVVLALLISLPLGVGAAIYLVEYTGKGNKLVGLVRLTAETLTGIPSIVYGLFGMLFFVNWAGWKLSLISGSLHAGYYGTCRPLCAPPRKRSKVCPDSFREGSFWAGSRPVAHSI